MQYLSLIIIIIIIITKWTKLLLCEDIMDSYWRLSGIHFTTIFLAA